MQIAKLIKQKKNVCRYFRKVLTLFLYYIIILFTINYYNKVIMCNSFIYFFSKINRSKFVYY